MDNRKKELMVKVLSKLSYITTMFAMGVNLGAKNIPDSHEAKKFADDNVNIDKVDFVKYFTEEQSLANFKEEQDGKMIHLDQGAHYTDGWGDCPCNNCWDNSNCNCWDNDCNCWDNDCNCWDNDCNCWDNNCNCWDDDCDCNCWANSAPTISSVTSPVANGIFSATVPISLAGSVIDANWGNTLTVYYRIDSGTSAAASTLTANGAAQAFTTVSVPVGSLTSGAHTLYVWVQDNMGAKSAETSIAFTTDNTVPTISSVTATPTATTIQVTITASDNLGIKEYSFDNGATWQVSNTKTFTGLIPGTQYTYNTKVKDNLGNISAVQAISKYTDPNLPSALTSTSGSGALGRKINLSWNANSNASGTTYELEVSDNGTSGWTNIYTGTATTFSHTSLTTGVTKYYRVRAKNGGGVYTSYTSNVAGNTLNSPVVTSSYTSSGVSTGKVRAQFSWSAVPGATSYGIWIFDGRAYRFRNIGNVTSWDSDIAKIYPTAAQLTAWTGTTDPFRWAGDGDKLASSWNPMYVKANGGYTTTSYFTWIHIAAVDPAGNISGDTWAGATSVCSVLPDNDAPNTPAAPTLGTVTTNSIALTTTAVTDKYLTANYPGSGVPANGYNFRNDTTSIESSWTTNSYTFTGLTPNTSQVFKVQAKDNNGNTTPFSTTVSKYTLAAVPSLTVGTVTSSSIQVIINPNGNPAATQYYVQRATNSTFTTGLTTIQSWTTTTNILDSTGISPGVTYYYRAMARNGENINTAYSTVLNKGAALTVTFSPNGDSTPAKSNKSKVTLSNPPLGYASGYPKYQWTTSSTFPSGGTWTSFTSGHQISISSGDGNYYLHIYAVDGGGNETRTTSNAFVIDNAGPNIPNININPPGLTPNPVTVTINYPGDAVNKYYRIERNGTVVQPSTTYTAPFTLNRNSTIFASCQDSVGNWSAEARFDVTNIQIIPTLNDPTFIGKVCLGEDIAISSTGTNISSAKYKVYFTEKVIAPSTTNIDAPSSGWKDAGIIGDMNISGNAISTTIAGNTYSQIINQYAATYMIIKVWVGSETGNGVEKFSPAYSMSMDTADPAESIINYVAHNQVINVRKSATEQEQIVVSRPNTTINTYGPYQYLDELKYNNFAYNDTVLTYRLEFDVVDPTNIRDIKIDFDFNDLNTRGVDLQVTKMELHALNNGTNKFQLLYSYNGLYTKEVIPGISEDGIADVLGRSRYSVSLKSNAQGINRIKTSGATRYAIVYEAKLNSEVNAVLSDTLIRNQANITVYTSNGKYGYELEKDRPGRRTYVDTRVTKNVDVH